MLILSGKNGTLPIELTMKSSLEDFILLFQQDLADICTAFKAHLGIDIAYNRIVPKPGRAKFAMCRFVAFSSVSEARRTAYTFEIILGRAGSQTAQAATPNGFVVEYTLERLTRLLQANGNLNRHAGISQLVSIEGGLSIPEAHGIQGTNLDIASLLVTYARDEAPLYPSNR